jgi:hypothetical protein
VSLPRRLYIRGLFMSAMANLMETPPDDVPDMLMRSARFAFIQTVRGIFAGQAR